MYKRLPCRENFPPSGTPKKPSLPSNKKLHRAPTKYRPYPPKA
jgi:hypothetical protein